MLLPSWCVPALLLGCLVLLLAAGAAVLRDRAPTGGLLRVVLALQALVLVQAVVLVLRLSGHQPAEQAAFLAYLVLTVLLLPGAFALAVGERSRYGSAVLAVGAVVLGVVELRLRATSA